jgi:hypothetical protein
MLSGCGESPDDGKTPAAPAAPATPPGGAAGGQPAAHITYYVKSDGSDANLGTATAPLKTVGVALQKLAAAYSAAGKAWPNKDAANEGNGMIVILGNLSIGGISIDETAGNKYPPIVLYGGAQGQAGTLSLATATGTLLTVKKGASVSLQGITLQGKANNNAAFVKVEDNGKLFLKKGALIRGNHNTAKDAWGGGVLLSGSTGSRPTLTMEGGTITANSAAKGGGVGGTYGVLTMDDGIITGNSATAYGGGVGLSDSRMDMEYGVIKANLAGSAGGGVYLKGTETVLNMGAFAMLYGMDESDPNFRNVVGAWNQSKTSFTPATGKTLGHAVYVDINSTVKKRDNTIGHKKNNQDDRVSYASGKGWKGAWDAN